MTLNENIHPVLKELTPFLIVINGVFINFLIITGANYFQERFISMSIAMFGSYILLSGVIYFYQRHLEDTGGVPGA